MEEYILGIFHSFFGKHCLPYIFPHLKKPVDADEISFFFLVKCLKLSGVEIRYARHHMKLNGSEVDMISPKVKHAA